MSWLFEQQKQEFEDSMVDDTHVYVGVHGYPLVSGYICEFNQSCAKEEDLRSAKRRKTGEAGDSSKNVESSAVPLYLWSSPALFGTTAGMMVLNLERQCLSTKRTWCV
jgi:hypothetical protein